MYKQIRFICTVLAAALLAGSVPALAEEPKDVGGYVETACALPQFDRQMTRGLYAWPDGRMDCFTKADGSNAPLIHSVSADGGKTWRKQDDLQGLQNAADVIVASDGTLYAIKQNGKYSVDTPAVSSTYYTYGIIEKKNGALRNIPNFKSNDSEGMFFMLFEIPGTAELAVSQRHMTAQSSFYVVDLATGATKSKIKTDAQLQRFGGGTAFGYDVLQFNLSKGGSSQRRYDAVTVDPATGRELYRGDWKFTDENYLMQQAAMGKDGSVYGLNRTGLYRLAPGGSAFEKIIDGKAFSLDRDSLSADAMAVGDDGSVYVMTQFNKVGDPRHLTGTTLYRYTPKK